MLHWIGCGLLVMTNSNKEIDIYIGIVNDVIQNVKISFSTLHESAV